MLILRFLEGYRKIKNAEANRVVRCSFYYGILIKSTNGRFDSFEWNGSHGRTH